MGSFLSERLAEIAASGTRVPVGFEALERAAEQALPAGAFEYVAGAAGSGATRRANRRDFERWRIVPRAMRDVADRDLSVDFLGETVSSPLLVAPIGAQRAYHPDGERATASAAARLGVPLCLSTWSSTSMESVVDAMDGTPALFQLYWLRDTHVTASLVRRAEATGFDGFVLTVDSRLPTWRPRALGADYQSADGPWPILENDPAVTSRYGPNPAIATPDAPDGLSPDPSLTWDHVSELRERTDLPIVVKGLLRPADAVEAVERGVDGIVVSTHGGRQIDQSVSAIEALPAIVEAVDGAVPIVFDSGVRTGAHAFVALALGADLVSFGRPVIYGLGVDGKRGVYEVLHNVLAELESVMGLSGYPMVEQIDESAVCRAPE